LESEVGFQPTPSQVKRLGALSTELH